MANTCTKRFGPKDDDGFAILTEKGKLRMINDPTIADEIKNEIKLGEMWTGGAKGLDDPIAMLN